MSGTHLIVLLLAGAPDAAKQLEQQAGLRIELHRVHPSFHTLLEADAQSLLRVLQSEGGGLVVLAARSTLLSEETFQKLLDSLRNPVLLIR
jgi:aspartate aminotransferase-like enzyme